MKSRETPTESQPPAAEGNSLESASRHALVYAMAVLIQRAISFVMLPVYTRVLTPSDYGVSQLLDMTVEVAGILLVTGTVAGMQRMYFRATSEVERKAIISTTLFSILAQGAVGTLALCLLAPWLYTFALGPAATPAMIRLSAVNFSLGLLPFVPLLVYQIERRSLAYAVVMIVKLTLQLSFNILFVVAWKMGVWGILVSTTLASGLVGGAVVIGCLQRTGFSIQRHIVREIARFGLPYRIAGIGTFVLTFGDRYFLNTTHGAASVGLYSLSYQFGFLLGQLGHTPVMSAWEPQRYLLAKENEELLQANTLRGFLLYNVVMLTIAVALACGARPVMRVLVGPEFRSAAAVVPIVVAAYVFNNWYVVTKFGVDIAGNTRPLAIATWVSVIATCVAYVVLIPPFGAMGAGWATLLGFVVRFAVLYPKARAARPLEYGWGRICAMAGVAFALMAVSVFVRPPTLPMDALISIAECAVFLAFTWYGIIPADDRDYLLERARSKARETRATLRQHFA